MKDLIIVGAGGFGRETIYVAERINENNPQWNIKGFIDDNLSALDNVTCDYPIIGRIQDWVPTENEVFALGISSPAIKEKLSSALKARGAVFETLISPRAFIGKHVTMGEGCVVLAGAIGDCVQIGDFVHIASTMIGQDSLIGDYSTTTGFANIVSAKLGKRVFVGSHAVIMNNRRIGDDAFICAGSIVFSHVKPNTKVFGNPAKKITL